MVRSGEVAVAAAALCAAGACWSSTAFTAAAPGYARGGAGTPVQGRSLRAAAGPASSVGAGGALAGAAAALGVGAVLGAASSRRQKAAAGTAVVPLARDEPVALGYYARDQLVACRAQLREAGAPSVEEVDQNIQELEAVAKKALGTAAAAVVFAGSMADSAVAYPIFAQQNYANPREATGKIVCANCHLASKPIDVRMPHDVLKDTIFKVAIEVPCKYEKRVQPLADGSKGPLNVGAIAIMPEGWKLAPKDRLPKVLKKEMKGLAWAPYSKEKPNIVVAGPVPGKMYETMVLPVLAPNPETQKDMYFGKLTMYFGANRGRGQVYPEGNQSNNNQFQASVDGTVTAIDGLKITYTKDDGSTEAQDVLPGADIVVEVGDKVKKGEPITTNPNVGGFGQEEKEMMLQDMNRIYAYCALATSIFFAQLSFVLKKKQFEKVQLAEGF